MLAAVGPSARKGMPAMPIAENTRHETGERAGLVCLLAERRDVVARALRARALPAVARDR